MTMSGKTGIQVRDARDRLIDLLGIGKTYPLRDLPVPDEGLMVPYNTTSLISIGCSQEEVRYRLYERDGSKLPVHAEGTGETLGLETALIREKITFRILASKLNSLGGTVATGPEAYLHETATVEVGLDTSLRARIRPQPDADPPPDPHMADYGASIVVEIENSQEGVKYRLVHFPEGEPEKPQDFDLAQSEVEKKLVLSQSDEEVPGTRKKIDLPSKPMHEDTEIFIRATKIFDDSSGRTPETDLLKVKLPLKVRANTALPISVEPSPIVQFGDGATVEISETQKSAKYRLFTRRIPDRDFIHRSADDTEVVRVRQDGEPEVQVRRPPRPEVWQEPEGYEPHGDPLAGNGDVLRFGLESMSHDTLVIVQAFKDHDRAGEEAVTSLVQLEQPAVVLVRPDPAPELKLAVSMAGEKTDGLLRVFDGQPGVFYHFRKTPNGKELAWPAYFHQHDESNARVNKGLGQLKIGIDFVVAADPPAVVFGALTSRAETAPETPLLETGPIKAGTTLYIRAVKAQTRIARPLDRDAEIAALPEIGPEEPVVDFDTSARILIRSSREGERYELLLNGQKVRNARNGNGQDLVFTTEPLTVDTAFEMRVTRPGQKGIPVVRLVPLPLTVRPDAQVGPV